MFQELNQSVQHLNKSIQSIGHGIQTVWSHITHPLQSLIELGHWVQGQYAFFLAVMVIGILLWMFGLSTGKKIALWAIALYTILGLVLAAA